MTACDAIRERFSALLEDELDAAGAADVQEHLAACPTCAELYAVLADNVTTGRLLDHVEAPPALATALEARPCDRWLALLFAAVDHELPADRLDGLVQHLDGCPGCRRAWSDLTLLHQAGQAVVPPPGLLQRCAAAPHAAAGRRIFGIRTATAAAYVLAVLTSLLVGNPVSLARHRAAPTVQQVTEVVQTEMAEAAATGRGELRVLLWRTWQWGVRQAEATRDFFTDDDTGSDASQGG